MQQFYIQDHQSLVELCQMLEKSALLTIDTEFVRTRTYYPNLGLLQVCDGEMVALIDPLAISDLTPFWQIMTNANIRKVIHACSEDLEVFLSSGNCQPVNMIDSQIMMAFLGHGLSMGYAAMIEHFTDIVVDKSESRTDWLKRPLTDKQISYAQADVVHLFEVYPKIVAQLANCHVPDAAFEETQRLIARKFSPTDEEQLYQQIKLCWKLNPVQLNRLKYLSKWRYQRAITRNIPLGFVAKDHTLIALAERNPDNVGQMATIDGVEVLDVRHQGKAMLAVLRAAGGEDERNFPARITRLDQHPGYKQSYKKVKTFIENIAGESALTLEIMASKKQINKFLSWHFQLNDADHGDIEFFQGWRYQLFGQQLKAFAENQFQ